jgi:hypothetical protein
MRRWLILMIEKSYEFVSYAEVAQLDGPFPGRLTSINPWARLKRFFGLVSF